MPEIRSSLVPRPRLIAKLNLGLNGKSILVSAPAGFGKTTLLSEWVHNSQFTIDNLQFSWLSLDGSDNDLARFLAYLVAALRTIEANIGETAVAMLQSAQPQPIESVLTSLINELVQIANFFILVLDDYHHISAQPVHDALAYLINNMPPNMLLVIISRSDPPLPLSRLRARGQMTEIRQAELRFTAVEAATFLNDVMGLSLTTAQVEMLETRTEGWIAGLQLAALSMQGREDIADFIEAFSGSHRFVMDYLADEVLQQQDEETRRFLYQTAILDHLTAPLCDVLTGKSNSQVMLGRLEQTNLFIIPLDNDRQWYRYHHLFADLLRQRLSDERKSEVSQLHRRAAAWYEERELTTAAINHWLASGDLVQAVRIMESRWLSTLNRGEMTTVMGWLAALPADLVQTRPWLCIARAWTFLLTGQVKGIEPVLEDAVQATANDEAATARHVSGHAAAIRAYVSIMMGDVPGAAHHAQEALARLPEEDASTRSVVTFTLGGACLFRDDIGGAGRAFAEAASTGKASGNIHLAIPAMCALGTLQIQCGALHLAMETFDDAQRMATGKARRALPIAAGAYNGKGQLYYEWNDLETAASYLETAVALARQWGNVESLISAHVFLAQVYLARGDGDGAFALLQHASQQAQGKQFSPGTESLLTAGQMRVWLARGNLASALYCVQDRELTTEDKPSYLREAEYIALARLLIAQSRWDEVEPFLARLLQAAEAEGRTGKVIEILVLRAVTHQALSDKETAVATMERALRLAEPEGYMRTFADAGLPVRVLLEQAAVRGIVPNYTAGLLATFPALTRSVSHSPKLSGVVQAEPLSEYELKVLRLVSAGLSNREVAEALYLSVNTVKWHLKNIYGKLDVHGRVEAISRAQELGLL